MTHRLYITRPELHSTDLDVIRLASLGLHVQQLNARTWMIEQPRIDEPIKQSIAQQATKLKADFAFLPAQLKLSDFKVLVSDMDSTLITIECIDEIADYAGRKEQVAAITAAAMAGQITDFSQSLRARVALLEGVPVTALQAVYHERLHLTHGAQELLNAVRRAGIKTMLVSGGFTYFADRVQQRLKMDFAHSNVLEVDNGLLTGKVLDPIVDGQAKADFTTQLCNAVGCPTSQAITLGDGANDLKMMVISGLSVAHHAKQVVREQATVSINHNGLDVVLDWLQHA